MCVTYVYNVGIAYINKEVIHLIVISHKKRINLLATFLINHDYATVEDMTTEFHISRRSAFYWIRDLNLQLDEMGLNEISSLTQSNYFLDNDTKKALKHYDNLVDNDYPISQYTKEQRHDLMIWFLIQKNTKVTLSSMSRYFDISKNTAINDIQNLKNSLPSEFELVNSKNGKILSGDERSKRIWVYQQMCTRDMYKIISDTHGAHYRYLIKQLSELQKSTRVVFSDNALELMASFLAWCLKRIQLNENLFLGHTPYRQDSNSKKIDDWSISLMHQFDIPITKEEVIFFRDIVYSSQTKTIPNWKFIEEFPADILVDQIIDRFGSISGASVNSSSLRQGLKTHIISTYQRVRCGIPYRAQNLKQIKSEYAELMTLTSYAIQPLETYLKTEVSDDEVSLITTYFGGQTNYLENTKKFNSNIDVLLVCSSGIGTSYFLQQTLIRKYSSIKFSHPMSLAEFNKLGPLVHAKLVISTIDLSSNDLPKVLVQGIPTENDFIQIEKALRGVGLLKIINTTKLTDDLMDIISNEIKIPDPDSLANKIMNYFNGTNKHTTDNSLTNDHPTIADLLPPENIRITSKSMAWKQAIQKAFIPLLSDNSVDNTYVTEIINKLEAKGPFMIVKKGVLLAHASPSNKIHKIGMSLLKLESSINMDGKPINVIICLAPKREKQHLQALSGLLDILQNEKKYQILIGSNSKAKINKLIQNYAD